APSASATSCRTPPRSCTRGRSSRARSSCCTPRTSSWRATCSTGGIRPPAEGRVRASRTTSSGSRGRRPSMSARRATGACWTSPSPSSPRDRSPRARTRPTSCRRPWLRWLTCMPTAAVRSGVAPPARAAQAIDAVERELVDEHAGLVRLLTPPFDRTAHDPGYIKGYVPGVRENGGQYTHAALWVVGALAALGRRERAAALLQMLGPVHHTRTAEAVAVYRVEPYVVAADVYGAPPHVGRGGWTWYTGSAGWMYRTALE